MNTGAQILLLAVLALVALTVLGRSGSKAALESQAREALEGFWTAPPEFCRRAGLHSMNIVVGPPRKNKSRVAYLSAAREDGALIDSQFFVMRPERGALDVVKAALLPGANAFASKGGSEKWARLPHRFAPKDRGQFLLPCAADILVQPAQGRLRIHGKKKVWADLLRDSSASLALKGSGA
jgi:hypothetical protein